MMRFLAIAFMLGVSGVPVLSMPSYAPDNEAVAPAAVSAPANSYARGGGQGWFGRRGHPGFSGVCAKSSSMATGSCPLLQAKESSGKPATATTVGKIPDCPKDRCVKGPYRGLGCSVPLGRTLRVTINFVPEEKALGSSSVLTTNGDFRLKSVKESEDFESEVEASGCVAESEDDRFLVCFWVKAELESDTTEEISAQGSVLVSEGTPVTIVRLGGRAVTLSVFEEE